MMKYHSHGRFWAKVKFLILVVLSRVFLHVGFSPNGFLSLWFFFGTQTWCLLIVNVTILRFASSGCLWSSALFNWPGILDSWLIFASFRRAFFLLLVDNKISDVLIYSLGIFYLCCTVLRCFFEILIIWKRRQRVIFPAKNKIFHLQLLVNSKSSWVVLFFWLKRGNYLYLVYK